MGPPLVVYLEWKAVIINLNIMKTGLVILASICCLLVHNQTAGRSIEAVVESADTAFEGDVRSPMVREIEEGSGLLNGPDVTTDDSETM